MRRLFTLLSALSLLLCVGTCVLWVRSLHVYRVEQQERERLLQVVDRMLQEQIEAMEIKATAFDSGTSVRLIRNKLLVERTRAAASLKRVPYSGRKSFSYFLVSMLFGMPSIVWLIRRAGAKNRSRRGLCHVCGYDLRATPERCPECGTVRVPK
jgi:hypothetical protein